MAVREPRSVTDAQRLLETADTSSEEGKRQIAAVAEWMSEQDSVPRDLQRKWAEVSSEASQVDFSSLVEVPADQLRWVWERSKDSGRLIIDAAKWAMRDPTSDDPGRDLFPSPRERRETGPRAPTVEEEARTPGAPGQGGIGEGTGLSGGDPQVDDILGRVGADGEPLDILGLEDAPEQYERRQIPRGWQIQGELSKAGMADADLAPDEPYYENSALPLLKSMTTEERTRLQEILVASGLAPSVIPGDYDDGTIAGFERLLGMANRNGERWKSTFARLRHSVDSGALGDGAGQETRDPFRFVEQTYLPPDPAEIRNSIRDLAERIVPDVELSDEEIERLRSSFEQFGRQQFESQEQQRRFEAEATYDANAPATAGQDEIVTTAEAAQPVSAADRFREHFEERFSANIARRDDAEEEVERRQVTGSNLGQLLQFATGGR